jgi:hypothetical protein
MNTRPRVPARNLEGIGPAEFGKEYVDLCTLHSPRQGMFPFSNDSHHHDLATIG